MDEVKLWHRQSDEPLRWYQIFVKYYLGMGLRRTLHGAYLRFLEETDQQAAEKHLVEGRAQAPARWRDMAIKWDWRKRAESYEEEQTALAQAAVDEASRMIRLEAPHAVRALILALDEMRNRVPAANAILDRSGLPAVTRQEVANVTISADDLAAARKEVEEWESQQQQETQPESGSSAQSPAPTS